MQIDHKVNNHVCCVMTLLLTVYHDCRAVLLFWCVSEGELRNNNPAESVLPPHPELLDCNHRSTGQQDDHIRAIRLTAASQPAAMLFAWYASPPVSVACLLACFA